MSPTDSAGTEPVAAHPTSANDGDDNLERGVLDDTGSQSAFREAYSQLGEPIVGPPPVDAIPPPQIQDLECAQPPVDPTRKVVGQNDKLAAKTEVAGALAGSQPPTTPRPSRLENLQFWTALLSETVPKTLIAIALALVDITLLIYGTYEVLTRDSWTALIGIASLNVGGFLGWNFKGKLLG